MVNEGKGRLFRRKDGKYLIYVPVDFCEDSMFPFKVTKTVASMPIKVSFEVGGAKKLIIEEWKE